MHPILFQTNSITIYTFWLFFGIAVIAGTYTLIKLSKLNKLYGWQNKSFKRFDKSVGGFGIGLNIVSLIAKEYDLKIDVISKIDVGTRIKIRWQD